MPLDCDATATTALVTPSTATCSLSPPLALISVKIYDFADCNPFTVI